MDLFLFILVNAVLFIRPGEIFPETEGWPIYNYTILLNLIVAGPAIISHLTSRSLAHEPATFCVLGVLASIFLSHLARFDLWSARMGAFEFAKIVAYFLILVTTVNTPQRLGIFLAVIAALTLVISTLAVLHYNGVIEIHSLTVLMQNDHDELTGEAFKTPRLQATGIFGDPNDLSMIIVVGIAICACGLCLPELGAMRLLLVAPIGFFGYALLYTQSRGGLLALLGGLCAGLYAKFGAMKAGLLAAVMIPLALVAVGGRQADIGGGISKGTGHSRAELWSTGLQMFKSSPLTGIGYNLYEEGAGQVAHNSFVHAFVELGLPGGALFLGLFGIAGWSLWQLNKVPYEIDDPTLRQMLPFMVAMLAAYCVSMLSLSRNYVIPTYLAAGIATAYVSLALPGTSVPAPKIDGKTLNLLGLGSVGFIVATYFYIKILHRM